MHDAITYELHGAVARVVFDDGKANALTPEVLAALTAALERAEREAGAFLLLGRPGRFCAGFELSVITGGGEAARALLHGGASFAARLLESPLPVIAGCTGHAVAMGALLLLAADFRVGVAGAFKLGLNEIGIRMPLPEFALLLVRERISKLHALHATLFAELYDPERACEAGYLDRVASADAFENAALETATRFAALPRDAFAATKTRLREPVARALRESLQV